MTHIESNRPSLTNADAEAFVKDVYLLTATATPLPSELDQNFHLVTESAGEYILKVSHLGKSGAVIEFENGLLNHLASHFDGDLLPRLQASRTGEVVNPFLSETGDTYMTRLFGYLPGVPLVQVNPRTPTLLDNLGQTLGKIDLALSQYTGPIPDRDLPWDAGKAESVIRENLGFVSTSERRKLLLQFLEHFESYVQPLLSRLPVSVIHNDANDHNVLVRGGSVIAGIIDFGDALRSYTINELAVAAAYAMMGESDPLLSVTALVSGYHAARPLTELEVEMLYPLICARLCVSVSLSARRSHEAPENDYLRISESPAWSLLEKLTAIGPSIGHYVFRHACGMTPSPRAKRTTGWLISNRGKFAPVLLLDLAAAKILDLSIGSPLLQLTDRGVSAEQLFHEIESSDADLAIGRYNEPRLARHRDILEHVGREYEERPAIHIGLDLFADPGTPVYAPLTGKVHSCSNGHEKALDHGPSVIIEHSTGSGDTFFSLYGNLGPDSLSELSPGMEVSAGQKIGTVGDSETAGGWPPHLHFQVMIDHLGKAGDFPGMVVASQRQVWLSICPNPNLILEIPSDQVVYAETDSQQILHARRRLLGQNLSVSYRKPLHIVRGWRQYLYDETGRSYLDCVNNVCHVGHSHPRVVTAISRQAAILNTNTRYLHQHLVRLAQRLCATLPSPLSVCFFVCSGSEANELALRLARAYTGAQDVLVLDNAYHGNTNDLIEISPYKLKGPGGRKPPDHVHVLPMPDVYRGLYRSDDPMAGDKYGQHIQTTLARVAHDGRRVAAFICESALGCGGQIILPDGYLGNAFQYARQAGAVCIADEVQVGFGRMGSHFWAFETQDVIPDIVTLGKPIGNGHPLAAVVTTPEIAASFANGMEYFNTFGGNPVSCAAGLAVLDVIEDERLQDNALQVGQQLKAELGLLMDRHQIVGDVRGLGLFVGVELVKDRLERTPASAEAAYVVERMRDHGVLISSDGPDHNVLKIKPPMVFTHENAKVLVATLDRILAEDSVRIA